MADDVQNDSPGKDNSELTLESLTLNTSVPTDSKICEVNLPIVRKISISNAPIKMALVNASAANLISQFSNYFSREMLELTNSYTFNTPVDTVTKMDKRHKILSKITSFSSSLTTAFLMMSQKINSQPLALMDFFPNSQSTQSVSSPSVLSSTSFPFNAVNCETQLTKCKNIQVHRDTHIVKKENKKPLALVDYKANKDAWKINLQNKQSPTLRTDDIVPKAVKTHQAETLSKITHTNILVGCPWCQEMFSEQNKFVEHLCGHTNIRRFKCLQCPTIQHTEAPRKE